MRSSEHECRDEARPNVWYFRLQQGFLIQPMADERADDMAQIKMQSRTMSFAESVTNVLVGFAFAFVIQVAIFPMFGISISAADNLWIAVIFTVISVVRSFTLRRLFEALLVRGLAFPFWGKS